jgi:ABC-type sugar transport system permease subunit
MNFIGLDNFARALSRDKQLIEATLNTFKYAFFKIIITIPLAFMLAVLLNSKLPGRNVFRSVLFTPTIVAISAMSMVFYLIFNVYNGVINNLLLSLGIVDRGINWFDSKHAMTTVIMIAVWGGVGNYMLYILAGLQSLPTDVYESAEIDGATKWKQFLYITVPMMMPIMQMVLMLAIIQAFKDYENILVMTAGGPNGSTTVLYLYVYKLMFPVVGGDSATSTLQYGYGSTVALLTAVLIGIITFIYMKWSKRVSETF